jgi:N-acyl-D-aspartate/D-glutamate deacylase
LPETLLYAKLARGAGRPFFLHLRYSSAERELEGVEEAVYLAEQSGARVHIAHLHSTGGTFHMERALELIREARGRGAAITTCVYPYSYWATYLNSKRFDSGWQRRYGLDYGDLRVVGTGERLTSDSFQRYRGMPLLVAVPEGTMPLERTLDLALQEDFCCFASDGGIQGAPRANSHPRGAGCFATALRRALDTGLPLERALAKMTSLPASLLGSPLTGRGVLDEGTIADLTVFDPRMIAGNATVENPNQFSSGIELVIVNGRIGYRGGVLRDKQGTPIRGPLSKFAT